MRNAHFAYFNEPGPVHVHPTLSVVSALVRRGHRVTYVTSERYASALAALGAELVPSPRLEYPFNQKEPTTVPPPHQRYAKDLFDLASLTVQAVSEFYVKNVPDLIIYDDCAYAGPIISTKLGVPSLRASVQLDFDKSTFSSLGLGRYSATLDEFLRERGVMANDFLFTKEQPILYFYANEFRMKRDAEGARHFYAARCAAERPYDVGSLRHTSISNRPRVLVSTSTIYEQGSQYYYMCREAINSVNQAAVLALGSAADIASFDKDSPNCEVVVKLPLISLMPWVDSIICIGGISTTMEAMYHGLPMLMITHGFPEAEMYADNNERVGIGIHLKKGDLTHEHLRSSIVRLSQCSKIRDAVARIKQIVRSSPGGEETANWIEEFLETT